jgi:hypothetical protein
MFASKELRSDREIVYAATKQNGWALVYADKKELLNDKELALLSLQSEPEVIEYVGDELRNDIEIAMLVVGQRGFHLSNLSEEMRDN